ncbi:carbohydrate ABC transporter permease [Clostridium haemolyticum]|uniref:ABC transporter permease n=1 Tax=Clostridium haemolyticum NCTC 9693 TaxID=1443114 RepID=A0ABR4TBJ7_CLOHA|nr:sugar ABC transporter permease [Clostridium haemolyticum]KEI14534.1 ABC transporter permease [Clostridium haemolyticum NCTC 9693]KGM99933.1 ABC transporter permease [Clostridium haemolyticum NCTC 8350]
MKKSKLWFSFFVAPILISFLIVVIIPAITGIYYSFTDWNGIDNNALFVGIQNYKQIFNSESGFMQSFIFTLKFSVVSVIMINLMGFGLALLVTREMKISNILRSIFFMPNMVGGLILGFIWQFIFTKVFNTIGVKIGCEFFTGWLSTTVTGFWALVILMSWQMSGYMMVVYIAALQGIPDNLKEAAEIDGANPIQRLINITIPLVAPAFTVGIFLTLSNCFKLFDQNLALTGGGPYNSTQMLALNIYNSAFARNEFGISQAKAVIFLITVAVITLTQLNFSKKKEVEM